MMDSFPYVVPPNVTMGSLISTILQLKSQVDFMDQFLLLYVPEYVQLKNYVIQTQQNGMGSNVPATIFPTSTTSVQPSGNETASASNLTPPPAAVNGFMRDQELSYSMRNGANTIPHAKSNVRRKQTSAKKTPVVPLSAGGAPATKRRGRKRKYPIITPNENLAHSVNNQNIQHQQACQNTEGVNGTKRMSSLDVLAAVSYVLKQKGGNNSSKSADQEVSPSPNVSEVDTNNVDHQKQQFSSEEHNNMHAYTSNVQNCHESHNTSESNDEHLKRDGGENEISLSSSLPEQCQLCQPTSDQFLSTHSPSSSVSHNITRSQEEYSVIMRRSPAQELIV